MLWDYLSNEYSVKVRSQTAAPNVYRGDFREKNCTATIKANARYYIIIIIIINMVAATDIILFH